MSLYPFHALLGRMKYITRWALMRCMRQESLSEHTADTALLAHALCLIARNITHTGADIRPDTVAAAALYHDAPEILTGDMPTPVKYKNEALRTAYKAVERERALAMADLLPPELHEIEGSYLTGSVLNDAERKLLKSVSLFDVYEGDKLPEGKKSYALSFILEDKTRTLDERTIERVMANLTRQFEQKCGAQVRA